MALHLRYAFALAACTALVAPPRTRIQRCTARRATEAAAEAAKIISDNLEAFSQAATATDAGLAMARIYDAIPKDDLSLDAVNPETGFLGQAERLDVFRELASRRDESGLWTQDNVESFKALRAALDPLHVTDLKGYLSFAGLLGGGLYIAALWVQQTLPEIFPAVYLFLRLVFAPVLFARPLRVVSGRPLVPNC